MINYMFYKYYSLICVICLCLPLCRMFCTWPVPRRCWLGPTKESPAQTEAQTAYTRATGAEDYPNRITPSQITGQYYMAKY